MIPRKPLDIDLKSISCAAAYCLSDGDREQVERRIEHLWSADDHNLVCLSVRSGFDALLSVLDLPAKSEILVSAVTIRDMPRIIEAHGLTPVPVDIDPRRLSLCPDSLQRALSTKSKAILIAHLFGSRTSMEPVLAFAKAHDLLVFEDCAQAFTADEYRGHPESDVSLFSFGPIKTASALQGAILRFRDQSLCRAVKQQQEGWPAQSQTEYFIRVMKYGLLHLLSYRPLYNLFALACRLAGIDHDAFLSARVRGFAGGDLFAKIRQRPSSALLRLIERRLRSYDRSEIVRRVQAAQTANRLLSFIEHPGENASFHSYWLYPVLHDDPKGLIRYLWSQGYDATRGASSMAVVPPPADRPELQATRAAAMFSRLLYLPVHSDTRHHEIEGLAKTIDAYQNERTTESQFSPASVH